MMSFNVNITIVITSLILVFDLPIVFGREKSHTDKSGDIDGQ